MIYHIVHRGIWESALANGFYEADSLRTEGFIHASKAQQVKGVLERYYQGHAGLLLLHIDEDKIMAEIKYEPAGQGDEAFPHIFGRLNLQAVIKVVPL